jgi:hypothetical protein
MHIQADIYQPPVSKGFIFLIRQGFINLLTNPKTARSTADTESCMTIPSFYGKKLVKPVMMSLT